MVQIEDTIISEDVFDYDFVCNLDACKGECCVEGVAGAPVEEDEVVIMKEIYPEVAPYLTEKGRKAIEEQGTSIVGEDGEWVTPLIDGGECAYVIRDEKGVVLCGIEQAYRDGKISWKKPISCHLYPIRLHKYSSFTAVNYDQWSICKDACILGKKLQVPVYKFLKEALVRKFGENWYQQLEESKKLLEEYRNEKNIN